VEKKPLSYLDAIHYMHSLHAWQMQVLESLEHVNKLLREAHSLLRHLKIKCSA